MRLCVYSCCVPSAAASALTSTYQAPQKVHHVRCSAAFAKRATCCIDLANPSAALASRFVALASPALEPCACHPHLSERITAHRFRKAPPIGRCADGPAPTSVAPACPDTCRLLHVRLQRPTRSAATTTEACASVFRTAPQSSLHCWLLLHVRRNLQVLPQTEGHRPMAAEPRAGVFYLLPGHEQRSGLREGVGR